MMEDFLLRLASDWWHTMLIVGAFVLGVAVIERLRPAELGQPWRDSAFNVVYGLWSQAVYVAIVPWMTVAATAWIRSRWPGMLSPTAALSWPAKAGLAVTWLFVYDLCYYAFHRAQHTWPVLWRQHLLHHSDYSVNAFTTFRHHWLEEPLKVFVVVVPMAIVFDAPPVFTGLAWLLVSGWPALIHANLRLGFGPGHWLLTSPQTHRVHHSRLPQHRDRNYAVFFPIIDRIFGSWYEPARDEYPPTGLDSGRRIRTQFEAAFSPFMPEPRTLAIAEGGREDGAAPPH